MNLLFIFSLSDRCWLMEYLGVKASLWVHLQQLAAKQLLFTAVLSSWDTVDSCMPHLHATSSLVSHLTRPLTVSLVVCDCKTWHNVALDSYNIAPPGGGGGWGGLVEGFF